MEQYLGWCWYLRWVHGLRWQRRCFGTDLIHWWYGVVWWCHKQVFWTLCRFRLIAFVITSAICQGWKVKGLNLLRLKICTLQRRQQDRLSYRPSRNPSGSKWLRLFWQCLFEAHYFRSHINHWRGARISEKGTQTTPPWEVSLLKILHYYWS